MRVASDYCADTPEIFRTSASLSGISNSHFPIRIPRDNVDMAVLYYKQLIAIFIFGVVDHPISSRIDLIDPFALFRPQARPNIFRRHGIDRRNGQIFGRRHGQI